MVAVQLHECVDEVAAHGLRAEELRQLGETQKPVGVPRGPVGVLSVCDPPDDVVRLGGLVQDVGDACGVGHGGTVTASRRALQAKPSRPPEGGQPRTVSGFSRTPGFASAWGCPASAGRRGHRPPHIRSIIACPKAERRDLVRAVQQPREVVGDLLVDDRRLHRGDDQVGRLAPAEVAQHHLGREDQRARVDLVLARVLRRRSVRRLEERDVVGQVRAGRDADAADLRGERVGDVVAVEVQSSRSRRTRPGAAGSAAGRRRRSRP